MFCIIFLSCVVIFISVMIVKKSLVKLPCVINELDMVVLTEHIKDNVSGITFGKGTTWIVVHVYSENCYELECCIRNKTYLITASKKQIKTKTNG